MFELHIEFSNDSLVFDYKDEDEVSSICHKLVNAQGFVSIPTKIKVHYINTKNILYFYVINSDIFKSNKEDVDF